MESVCHIGLKIYNDKNVHLSIAVPEKKGLRGRESWENW